MSYRIERVAAYSLVYFGRFVLSHLVVVVTGSDQSLQKALFSQAKK